MAAICFILAVILIIFNCAKVTIRLRAMFVQLHHLPFKHQ